MNTTATKQRFNVVGADPESVPYAKSVKKRNRFQQTTYLLLGIAGAFAFMLLAYQLNVAWTNAQNRWNYGPVPTSMASLDVQHGGISTFYALNANRHILVMEMVNGKTQVYPVTYVYGENTALLPVTLSFQDLNHDGAPDILVNVGGQQIALINDTAKQDFRAMTADEAVSLGGR